MNKDEFLEEIKKIGTCEDEVERRTMLANLSDKVSEVYDNVTVLETTKSELEESNNKKDEEMEKLRSANMKLFLRVGEEKTPEQIAKEKGLEGEPEPRKYEDLFDEKGGIK